jgi:hypothetical protein
MTANQYATVHGSPGEGARTAGIARALWPMLLALFCVGYAAGTTAGGWLGHQGGGTVLLLAGVLLLLGAISCHTRIQAFFKGAVGEEIVARELARLPADYHVFHSIETGGGFFPWRHGDMDHVVVGPTGVFVIETKNWRAPVTLTDGRLLVAGREPRRAPLAQVRQAEETLRGRLAQHHAHHGPIVPIVCFAGDRFEGGLQRAGEITVCNASRLLEVLTDESRRARAAVDVEAVVQELEAGRAG